MSGGRALDVAGMNLPGSYLVLELSNKCPLKCRHCAVAEAELGHPHYLDYVHMDRGMVRELMRDLRSTGLHFDNLVMFWLGEPLANPEFAEIYGDVLSYNRDGAVFSKVEVHTNCFPLTERICRVALNDHPVPQVWHMTMDAIRRETYVAIKGVDGFDRSHKNARRMVRLKGELRARNPKLVFQFIVSDTNAGEAEEFTRFWGEEFDRAGLKWRATGYHVPHWDEHEHVFLKQLDCPTPEEQDRQNAVYDALMGRMGLAPVVTPGVEEKVKVGVGRTNLATCSGFWKSPTVSSDGRVTVCTRDNTYHLVVGDLKRRSFSEIWTRSPLLARRRQQVARGDYSELPYCQTCFIPRSVNYTGIVPAEVARAQAALGLDAPLVELPRPYAAEGASPHPDDPVAYPARAPAGAEVHA